MDLWMVFIIIAAAILLIIGLLWLISWLTGEGKKEDDASVDKTQAESVTVKATLVPELDNPVEPETAEELLLTQKPDDLKVIEGIGPNITSVLNESGIRSFTQLAVTKVIILESILKEANIRLANPSTWPEQAALAAEGKWDELQTLKDELQGGLKVT